MSAAEVARLANIAMAEVGHAATATVDRTGRAVTARNPTAYKAGLLATQHVFGNDFRTFCAAHFLSNETDACERVPVCDALMGRTCGVS